MTTAAVITKNSASKIGEGLLRLVIHRACEEVPNLSLIIVDGESTDSTIRVIEGEAARHGVRPIVLTDRLHSRAFARSLALRAFTEVDDAYYMFLDDDAVLRRGWWSESMRLIATGCEAVWGINYDLYGGRVALAEAFGIGYVDYLAHEYEARGGTHDLLLTAGAVDVLSTALPIPVGLGEYEDAYIHWVLRLAKVRECINKVGVIHVARSLSGGYVALGGLAGRIPTLIRPKGRFTRLVRRLEYEVFRGRRLSRLQPYPALVKLLSLLQQLPLP